jgi:hypothetical protein
VDGLHNGGGADKSGGGRTAAKRLHAELMTKRIKERCSVLWLA